MSNVSFNNEFYSRYEDIEKQLKFYRNHLKNKIVYCNCDDWTKSNFAKYFIHNFHRFGLKELIVSGLCQEGIRYDGKTIRRFGLKDEYLIKGKKKKKIFDGGSYESKQCLELMEECDCIITNPPFSIFSEFVRKIDERRKDFLLIGDLMSVITNNLYEMFYRNKIWLPNPIWDRPEIFITPDKISKTLMNTTWISNFGYREIYKLELKKKFDDMIYDKFWNFSAINVDRLSDIPNNYFEWMGVPMNYFYYHNPEMFEFNIRRPNAIYHGECLRLFGRKEIPRVVIRRR